MLSSLHPYDYWVEDEQYHFKTPSGATYVAYFLKLPFADNLYTFNFDRLDPGVDGMELNKIDRCGRTEGYNLVLSLFVWDDNPDKERLIAVLDEYCDDLLN